VLRNKKQLSLGISIKNPSKIKKINEFLHIFESAFILIPDISFVQQSLTLNTFIMKIIIVTFVILAVSLWAWSIFDVTTSRFRNPIMSWIWLLVLLFFNVIGSIAYFQFRRKLIKVEYPVKPV
jgi:hypothetical protein